MRVTFIPEHSSSPLRSVTMESIPELGHTLNYHAHAGGKKYKLRVVRIEWDITIGKCNDVEIYIMPENRDAEIFIDDHLAKWRRDQ